MTSLSRAQSGRPQFWKPSQPLGLALTNGPHSASDLNTPEERFISVLRYYLAGWHIKPKGVKKPYNPVLGEFFRCRYDYSDGTSAYYIAEQVSHHPPVSAWSVSPHLPFSLSLWLRTVQRVRCVWR